MKVTLENIKKFETVDLCKLITEASYNEFRKNDLQKKAEEYLIGKSVKIIDPNFNGRWIGNSKKKLVGKIFEVKSVIVTDGKIFLYFNKDFCGIELDKVKLI